MAYSNKEDIEVKFLASEIKQMMLWLNEIRSPNVFYSHNHIEIMKKVIDQNSRMADHCLTVIRRHPYFSIDGDYRE